MNQPTNLGQITSYEQPMNIDLDSKKESGIITLKQPAGRFNLFLPRKQLKIPNEIL